MIGNMKKLALVYDAVYPFIKGGGEKRFYDIGLKLSKEYDVNFYCMKLWDGENIKKIGGMTYHGISKEIPLYDNNKRTIMQAIKFGFSGFKLIKEDFDIIDCCGFPYFSLFSVKLVCIIKGKKLYSKLPDKIIAVSDETKSKLIKQLKVNEDKIVVIPNGVDVKRIVKIKQSKDKSDVIYAGRLLSHKNIDVLIKAMKSLKEHKLMIVGDGPEMNNLKELTKQLNLEKRVIFKVFVIPSSREGFGITVIEANVCGIPVITINHVNNASKCLILKGKNGFICELDEKS